jgi:predicted acylesterase/phospholipase RssA
MNTASSESKLGLALSGGGFRSAFFHVGVLARLAELDLLRKIDVISSVSGGSIIAAFYYLKVKALIEQKSDSQANRLRQEDFIRLVQEIETEFLAAVQKNMRMRTFIDPGKTARMLGEDYSNTERLAELFTDFFFKPVLRNRRQEFQNDRIPLKSLPIETPAGALADHDKIPFLIINATSLNTGHLWQFTNVSVGERQTESKTSHDSIDFLKTFRLDDERLTIEQRKVLYNITLGQAVAASCCVPGILAPLRIRHLYIINNAPMTVRLADGGLVDNQGLASLFTENCTHIICSDASDILKTDPNPSAQILNVAMRANNILMDRIRNKSLNELYKYDASRNALITLGDYATQQDIFPADSEKIVQALSRIRTDLDSFTEREAYSLMYYGYLLCDRILRDKGFDLIDDNLPSETMEWRFMEIRHRFLTDDNRRKELIHHLNVGSRQMFKVFLLNKSMPYIITLPLPAAVILFVLFLITRISPAIFWGILFFAAILLIYTQNTKILRLIDNVTALRKLRMRFLKILLALRLPEPFSYIIALASWIQLAIFDRLFLRYGRVIED